MQQTPESPVPTGFDTIRRSAGDWGWIQATWFSTVEYLELNPDVATAGVNPFIHFLKRGSRAADSHGVHTKRTMSSSVRWLVIAISTGSEGSNV